MYIDIADDRNDNRLSMLLLCHSDIILHRHAKPLFLYPQIPYSQAYDHSVTVGLTHTTLLIETPLVLTRWRNLIHS